MHHQFRFALGVPAWILCLSAALEARAVSDWELVGNPGFSAGQAVCCQITFDLQGRPCVAYQDQTAHAGHAVVQRFDGTNWVSLGAPGQASLGDAWYDPLRFDAAGTLYLASRDYQVGGCLSVRRLPAGAATWTSVGPSANTPDPIHYSALELGPGGTPYSAFSDFGTTPPDRASVVRFNSATNTWDFVGPRGISGGIASYNTLAFDSQGTLYTAFADEAYLDPSGGPKATVMRWDAPSAGWVPVGLPGFSTHGAANLRLAIDHQDRLHVAYYRFHHSLVVMRFDGGSWVQLGGSASGYDKPAVESEGWRQWLSLCFDSQDRPYIAYELFELGLKAAVRRFDGTSWQLVGTPGFTPDLADYLSMAIDANDVPHVVFVDGSQDRRVSVMRYAPSPVAYGQPSPNSLGCQVQIAATGTAGFSATQPFLIVGAPVPTHKTGILLWSHAPAAVPFAGGTLYLQQPLYRSGVLQSGGLPGVDDCTGGFGFDFNPVLWAGDSGFVAGSFAFAQYWFRDTPVTSAVSAGLRFRIEP